MFNITVTTLSMHNVFTGFFISKPLSVADYEVEKNRITKRTLVLMGFENQNEYKEMYPGNYNFGSALETVLGFDKRDYSSCDTDLMCFGSILSVVLCVDPAVAALDTCYRYVVRSVAFDNENFCLPMVLFPKIEEFYKNVPPTDDHERYHEQLWFCEDWSEM